MTQQEAKSLASESFEMSAVEVEEEEAGTVTRCHSTESVLSSGTSIPAMRHLLVLPIAAAGVTSGNGPRKNPAEIEKIQRTERVMEPGEERAVGF